MTKQKPTPSRRDTARRKLGQVMQQAAALDRRRQAQIANQRASIDRLLQPDHGYTEEMAILHQAGAEAIARNQELSERVAELEAQVASASSSHPRMAWHHEAVSAPVSESGASAG